MARGNVPFLAFNNGIISSKALARVDSERTALSAEIMTNWLPSTRGPMSLRPGTIYQGPTLNDTGAYFIEFVAAIDQVALLECSNEKMRVWLGSDGHNLSLLSRPPVSTTLFVTDTGWSEDHIGGGTRVSPASDLIPDMTGPTTDGITVSASSETSDFYAGWRAGDDNSGRMWISGPNDTGWLKVDLGSAKAVESFTIRSGPTDESGDDLAPAVFFLQGNDVDTGDGWTTEVTLNETGWSNSELRTFTDTGYTDTGGNAWRHWRVLVHESQNADNFVGIGELELFEGATTDTGQAAFKSSGLSLNAGARGSIARVRKAVVVDTGDLNVEHSLALTVSRGPIRLRVGSQQGEDDLVRETSLSSGCHNLAFIPSSTPFHVTVQSDKQVDRVISSLQIGDSGTVELDAPWGATDLENIRFDQSADVIFVTSKDVQQHVIERRGTGDSIGRSWSVAKYFADFGPFRPGGEAAVKLSANNFYGNITLKSNIPFFKSGHVGALFKLTHTGQSTTEKLGNLDATTEAVAVTGIGDTGTPTSRNERRVEFSITGTYSGTIEIERSFESAEFGFERVTTNFVTSGSTSDTGTFSATVDDEDDNVTVWYRARLVSHTSGTAFVAITADRSVSSGIARVTDFTDSQNVSAEVLRQPSDTGLTEDWQEGSWSDFRGFPSAVAIHEGRLGFAGIANIWLSVSDDYNNFDEEIEGDSAPIVRTFGAGPIDSVFYLASMQRLLAGTADAEMMIRSSSFDEVLTPTNMAARRISSQGSLNLRPIKRDQDIFFVQRSKERMYRVNFEGEFQTDTIDMTVLAPEILQGGVVSCAIQRQPDTRMHFVLENGTVAILTYEPVEETLAWSKWQGDTGTNAQVEQVMVLPAEFEDAIYYLVRRDINGTTKRFLEKWAKESQSYGDTGLSVLVDSAVLVTDTGRNAIVSGLSHLAGETVAAWSDDTGQSDAGKDQSPDVSGVQTVYAVDTGDSKAISDVTLIPKMTDYTTDGVTLSASFDDTNFVVSAEQYGLKAWNAADQDRYSVWADTGSPSWLNVDFGSAQRVAAYSITIGLRPTSLDNAPVAWRLLGSTYDTGTFATDTGKWTLEDERAGQTDWDLGETKQYNMDTGADKSWRHWRLFVTAVNGDTETLFAEFGLFDFVADGITLGEPVHHVVAGLPYKADWKSSKLAYSASAGTALAQMKRVDKMGLILYRTHNRGLEFGNDTGKLDPLPRNLDEGATVDADKIYTTLDKVAIAFPGLWDEDSRLYLRARSPRPATVLAVVPTIGTNDRV